MVLNLRNFCRKTTGRKFSNEYAPISNFPMFLINRRLVMQKILALWATPRSTSTAFEWMMRMRGDFYCLHEPFGEPWYFGEDARWPRATSTTKRIEGVSFNKSWLEILKLAAERAVFMKDFPHYINHMWTDDFLENFQHSFLIRDPAKVTTSMYKHWPDFVLEETAIPEQRQLFDRIADQLGHAPIVIDSDDLLESPFAMVERYCDGLGIEYIESALSWQPGDRQEVSWYDGGSWHQNLKGSIGLEAQPRSYVDISDAPNTVQEIYQSCLPHYQHMHQYRLAP